MSEEDLFQQAMAAVKPIAATNKVPFGKSKLCASQRRVQPILDKQQEPLLQHVLQQESTWTWRASGVSREKLKRLASGEPAIEVELDLHGMNRETALQQLALSAQQMLAARQRVLCVIHGRGKHSADQIPVLKDAVYQWLCQGPLRDHVLALIPKPHTQGGSCLVLLRRSRLK